MFQNKIKTYSMRVLQLLVVLQPRGTSTPAYLYYLLTIFSRTNTRMTILYYFRDCPAKYCC